jgi:hypothetical protein
MVEIKENIMELIFNIGAYAFTAILALLGSIVIFSPFIAACAEALGAVWRRLQKFNS